MYSEASVQLNALGLSRPLKYIGKPEKIIIVNIFFISASINYYPLVRHFSTCEQIREIKKIQKRCLRIVINGYESEYYILLENVEK